MADGGFEIQVPITVKGGREGERVGGQIGTKIAEQINKSFRSIGIKGKTETATGDKGTSKSLANIGVKLGLAVGAMGLAVGLLRKSSPYLKGILDIFGRSFMIFFRPFGDFLATLLRPLAMLMMKMAVAFLKWTRDNKALTDPKEFLLAGGIPGILADVLFMDKLKEFTGWLWDKLTGIWNWGAEFDFGGWIWEKITGIWNWTYDFAGWLWDKVKGIVEEIIPGGGTKSVTVASVVGGGVSKVRDIIGGGGGGGSSQPSQTLVGPTQPSKFVGPTQPSQNIGIPTLGETIIGGIKAVGSKLKDIFSFGSYATGTPYVPNDGLYNLHRGEKVVPKGQNNQSMIFKPTFQITGNMSQDIDIDAIVRRAGRMTEMDLKSRGII